MILEITLKGAIIWKFFATFIFVLMVTGLFKRIYNLKMIHWLFSVTGIMCLILALNTGLIDSIFRAFKKKEIKTEYVTIEKNLDQDSLDLLIEFRAENERLLHEVTEVQNSANSNNVIPEKSYRDYLQTSPINIEQFSGTYTKMFEVPADGTTTGDWTIPYSPKGWWTKITWEGTPIWLPEKNSDRFILMSPGLNIDIGNHNPDNTNFCFKSSDGQPARVRLEYWSK